MTGEIVLIKLVFLMILLPVCEIAILIQTKSIIGLPWTLLLVIATGITGAIMLKQEGFSTLNRIQAALAQGQVPTVEIIDGVLVLAGGILLLTPGLLTDLCGFILMTPWSRSWLNTRLRSWFRQRLEKGTITVFPYSNR